MTWNSNCKMMTTWYNCVLHFLAIQPYCRHHDFEVIRISVDPAIHVLGFLNTGDVSSPPAFSRHLVLPLSAKGISVSIFQFVVYRA